MEISSLVELALTRECKAITYKRELPPNQRVIPRFIIYDVYDPPSNAEPSELKLRVTGHVAHKLEIPYVDILTKLPCVDLTTDFHCVTGWSVLNVKWRGVPTRYLLELAKPMGNYVMAVGLDGYTTNLPLEALMEDTSIVAFAMNGKILPREHGYPLRLVVPSRYGWKSAKYLGQLVVMDENERGYWELLGYHDNGDPWLEERYQQQETLRSMRRRVRFIKE
ncbi:sulfite oxidase-like oxidoreductase [Vulcanisaeta thermophila]|uniref:sulfite oxidase-like oxidoreductase n=1 Tax=Vulcanisaeta thermophila TaxID=867917 RepID=UPI000853C117|nr:sulfite oxidase-like oxidoreductase [Vulcanisaeta thermophila]